MAPPNFRLDALTALVTGAAGGIGAEIAIGLAEAGAAIGCLDIGSEQLDATVERVRSTGASALAVPADVTDPDALHAAVDAVQSELGPLTLAVNCAGIHSSSAAETMELAAWKALIDVNLTGVFLSCQAEGRAMLTNGGGRIVNVGSVSGTLVNRGINQIHYNTSKAGLLQLSRSLAIEWVDRGIRVNVLSPGYVRTGLARGVQTSRTLADFLDDIPMRRMAEPGELVGPAIFLLSDASSYCTGSELLVDGGITRW